MQIMKPGLMPIGKIKFAVLILAIPLGFLAAVTTAASEAQSSSVRPPQDFAAIARGQELYQQHCASCHGDQAQGAPNWRERGPDGKLQAPPLNGTGHAWHHPMEVLHRQIKQGSDPKWGDMPAYEDILSDRQINDIIVWFQSLWSEEIYQAWYAREQRYRELKAEAEQK